MPDGTRHQDCMVPNPRRHRDGQKLQIHCLCLHSNAYSTDSNSTLIYQHTDLGQPHGNFTLYLLMELLLQDSSGIAVSRSKTHGFHNKGLHHGIHNKRPSAKSLVLPNKRPPPFHVRKPCFPALTRRPQNIRKCVLCGGRMLAWLVENILSSMGNHVALGMYVCVDKAPGTVDTCCCDVENLPLGPQNVRHV